MTVPPKTSSGKKLRLKGLGVETLRGAPGDLLAEIEIVLPENLTDEDMALLNQINDRHREDPRSHLRW